MDNIDRYLKITLWLRKRWTVKGRLVVTCGRKLAPYSVCERLAWEKYMEVAP